MIRPGPGDTLAGVILKTRRDVLVLGLLAVGALPAAAREPAPVVAGHVVMHGAGRLADGVTALYRALGFGPSLIEGDRVRDRLVRDLGAASAAGIDPASPLGAVYVAEGAVMHRVPFVVVADRRLVEAGIAPGTAVVPAGGRGALVLAPSDRVGAAVAEYVVASGLDREVAAAPVTFRFLAAPFTDRSVPWLETQAEMLRGLARMASLFGKDDADLRLAAEAIDDLRALLDPWELVDGELFVARSGVRLVLRCVPHAGSEVDLALAAAPALPIPAPAERRDVALRAETSVGTDALRRWVERLVAADAVRAAAHDERLVLTVPVEGALLPALPGDGDGVVLRATVSLGRLRSGDGAEAGAPVHLFARVERGALRLELDAPSEQLRACVPRIEAR